ncbi:hypothetical protein CFK39_06530 [Brachybacterium avium]|uniref:RloB-like protein n=1 Tax=Brachybacterium avium TaxID=2017485 RepID=A0A220UBG0_9MICO|nr:RloB family protein [Brachybacterium avium]ASK65548.1 hypothetical protein CFK39_06530 [Brachybacterium avium]
MAADRRRRRRAPRTEKTSILLVTNGALTEKIYLEELKRRALRSEAATEQNFAVKVVFINGETDTLIKKLSSPHGDTKSYDEVWLVVDEDGRDRHPFLDNCTRQTTKARSWYGVVSRPCFEVWLIAHYEQVRRYADQKDAQTHYRRLIPDALGAKEIPSDFPYDAVGDAVPRSHLDGTPQPPLEELPPMPGTGMPHLVQRLGLVPKV